MALARTTTLPALSPEQEELLRQQVIDTTQPGSILHDFQILVDFVGTDGAEVSDVKQLLGTKYIAEINTRLIAPIQIALKRPLQNAYPSVQGLYLLLRTLGLSHIDVRGKKTILVIDPVALESWNQLNPTEQYFNLLEAWWLWSNDEILGEKLSFFKFQDKFFRCLSFWLHITDKGMRFSRLLEQEDLIYYLGMYNLALMQMFGLVSIQSGKPQAGKGWQVQQVKRSPWGDALILYLAHHLQRYWYLAPEQEFRESVKKMEEMEELNSWQSLFQPYFPEWKHNLELPEPEYREGLYIFRVSLDQIWRRIAIPDRCTFYDLSDSILDSVQFDDEHLHRFSYKDRFGWTVDINHPEMESMPPFSDQTCIGDGFLWEGATISCT
jgi:hypothetical protein